MTGSSFMSFVVAFKIWTDSQVDEANLINVKHIEPVNTLSKAIWKKLPTSIHTYLNNITDVVITIVMFSSAKF